MIKLKVHNPPKIKLKTSGYIGQPEGNIDLTENNTQYNVAAFATATTAIPEEIKHAVPSTVQQDVIPDEGLLKKVIVEPTPLDDITITPSTKQRTYLPQAPNIGFFRVIVEAVKQGLPIDPDSLTPLVFGIDSEGFYYSDDPLDETPVLFGRDSRGLYVTDGGD